MSSSQVHWDVAYKRRVMSVAVSRKKKIIFHAIANVVKGLLHKCDCTEHAEMRKKIQLILLRCMYLISKIFLFFRCFIALKKITDLPEFDEKYLFKGLETTNVDEFIEVYKRLNLAGEIKGYRKLLLKLFSKKCVLVVYDGDKLIGIDYFYFNFRDLSERTIHEGFVGVEEAYQRKGIASKLRSISTSHFASIGLGVSTRISTDNYGSFSSAKKNGFKVIETYLEDNGEERNYLVYRI